MVDLFVDPLVLLVIEKLGKILKDEAVLLVGVTDDVKKLSRTFTLIQAFVKDAETRRVKDEALKIWLQNLKDVAYDVDDILDEWMTEALISQAPDEGDESCFSKMKNKLALLSDYDCWLLFRSKALDQRSEEECSELEVIGRQIVKKCGGVPLAAKTIGSVMQLRRTRSQWELVLRSKMWNSGDVFEGILPALLLSYYDLPPALKQCLAYFSIFPKDRDIKKDTIVKLWVAQGSDGSVVEISKEASLNLNNNVPHSFLVDNDKDGDEAHKLVSISATLHKAHKLRTLLLQDSRISRVPVKLFHHLRRLRAMDLSQTDIKKLPWRTEELPEELSNCINLRKLRKLPRGMRKMISLRHLEFEGLNDLRYLPEVKRRLTELRTLTKFIVGGDDQVCKCGELKHLNHLQGSLRITGLQNVKSRDEASDAELHEKQHLHALYFEYDDDEPLDDEVKRMEDVLESLQPHTNLKDLNIQYYKGSKLPKWIGNPMFSNLVEVKLSHCLNCKQLPGLGKLPSLNFLIIKGMVDVKKVGGEFSRDNQNDKSSGGGVSFPNRRPWFSRKCQIGRSGN
ncbi:putative disease resistance protein RGA4 [Magnolia sinica]|uniref:putative disease resistance protein RGA4 n=1 Tax=Magnolia sinica TaxID=86752 RepID=UPI00265A67E0|nr:putative disease resistance protein RGA4 [Magnolia sinica]